MTWFVRVVLVGAVAAVWFLPPVPEQQATDTASISTYAAQMDLTREGDLSTVETIGVEMPGGKHGIFRIFDTADPRRDNVSHPVTVATVERDSQPEPYTHSDGTKGTDTIRIGDASVYLEPGAHTYRIVSSTSDVFEPGRPGETLWWWDVVGSGWQMPMAQSSVVVTLPAEPLRAECVRGDDQPCTASVEGTSLRVDTGPLAPFTPVTVRVAFDENDVAAPIPGAGGSSVLWAMVAGALALALAALLWWRTREREPGFPVLFEPPFMVPPALGVRVLDEKDSEADLQATLFDLAERGVLHLRGGDESWYVELVQPPEGEQLHPLEAGLLNSLGLRQVGDTFVVASTESSGRQVATARSTLRAQVSGSSAQYLSSSGAGITAIVLGWIALAATLFMVGRYFFDHGWVRWPLLVGTATFTVAIAGTMFRSGVATVRNADGRDLWSRAGGFARFLTTDSSEERFDAAAHMDWYPRYLAWAVALGVGDEWARRYEAQGVEVPDVPWIIWTGTGTRFSAGSMSRSFDGAISSATAAYAAAEAAKSSSSGGGGFSGGSGGGGGGGGSW
jgi:hypothetical protein